MATVRVTTTTAGVHFIPTAGVFVPRSSDPQTNVEALTSGGFVPLLGDINSPYNHRVDHFQQFGLGHPVTAATHSISTRTLRGNPAA